MQSRMRLTVFLPFAAFLIESYSDAESENGNYM